MTERQRLETAIATLEAQRKSLGDAVVEASIAALSTLPYQDRIDALEEIRAEHHGWKYDTQPGLQRVYSIVKR